MTSVRVVAHAADCPDRDEVRSLYQAAAEQPPLSEPPSSAELFATVYETSVESERVIAVVARNEGRLVTFAYGHPWRWDEQQYPWADELREELGERGAEARRNVLAEPSAYEALYADVLKLRRQQTTRAVR